MSFYIISEPYCQSSNWYRNIISGLMKEKRRKRFQLIMLNTIDECKHLNITKQDAIFVMGTDNTWLSNILEVCETLFQNRVILFRNHKKLLSSGKYSIIAPDIAQDIQILYDYLTSHGKNRIAMYGINPNSVSDELRKDTFLLCGANTTDLFYNRGSLSSCFEKFSTKVYEYDAVICTDNYASISLVQSFKNDSRLFITSCGGGTLLKNFFSPTITHTWIDYQSFGKVALNLYDILLKSESIHSINIYISNNLSIGDTTNNLPPITNLGKKSNFIYNNENNYYSDGDVQEMLRVETLLDSCDEEDFLMLDDLLSNATYAQMADKLYMSDNGVKYRVKKMLDICQVSSKKELIHLLEKYKR